MGRRETKTETERGKQRKNIHRGKVRVREKGKIRETDTGHRPQSLLRGPAANEQEASPVSLIRVSAPLVEKSNSDPGRRMGKPIFYTWR